MRWLAVSGVLLGFVATASADSTAHEHAQSSTTFYLASMWSPGPTVPIRAGLDGAVRLHRHYVALEFRLGGGAAASNLGLGGYLAAHGGASFGVALSLGKRIVVAPSIGYDAFVETERYGGRVWVHYATVGLPISVVLARGAVIELNLQAGIIRYNGVSDPALLVGPRIGIVF